MILTLLVSILATNAPVRGASTGAEHAASTAPAFVAGTAPVHGAISVVVRGDALVAGPTLELSEIADIRCESAAETQRISALCLGSTPAPGSVRNVTRDEIARSLRAAGVECTVAGAPVCRAVPRVELVSGRELEDAARKALAARFAGRDAEIDLVHPAPDLSLVAAERKRDISADLLRSEPNPGAWSVPVEVRVDGALVQTIWVAMDVRSFERVPVAARDLRRGDAFEAGAWTLERVRVEPSAPRSPDIGLLTSAVCARDVARGARIVEADMHREPLVRSGDEVELEVVRGVIRARTLAVARGQGALGDRIEVQSGESQRRLVGVVVARGLVRVELPESPRNPR
jgi:flagella basal body P-ring formation protein FlgA